MSEYSLDQAADLATLAAIGLEDMPEHGQRRRNCLYLALLSIELSLKAALEKAGMPVAEIRKMSHCLDDLLRTFSERCTFKYSVGVDLPLEEGRGAVIRSLTVTRSGEYLTVGYLLHPDIWGSLAKYPGEIRYKADVDPTHMDPQCVVPLAALIAKWLRERFATLRFA